MKLRIFPLLLALFASQLHAEETICSNQVLIFDDAVSKVLSGSPLLKISERTIRMTEGEKIQSRLLPNPVAAWSVENVFGNHNWKGWESAESRYVISQLVELGGKRTYRSSVAQFQYYSAQAGYEASKIEMLNRLMKLFVIAAATQEELRINFDQYGVAKEVLDSVIKKVEAGKVSIIEKNKAEISLTNAAIHLEKTKYEFVAAKDKLALLWGSTCPDFEWISYPFYDLEEPQSLCACLEDVRSNPVLAKSSMDYMTARQNLNLAESYAVPDVVFSVGYKTLQDTHDQGMILGAEIPLPIFNRNQGNIYKAKAEIARSKEEYRQVLIILENRLILAHRQLMQAYGEAQQYKKLLESGESSFELARMGYQEGKFEYLDVLDAQRTLFEIRERFIYSLVEYHQRKADIAFLTNRVD